MAPEQSNRVSELVARIASGDDQEICNLLPMVYEELRTLAGRQLSRERRDHTLQATALINEAYLRMAGQEDQNWEDRRHFLLTASTVMRHVLVDYARRRTAGKRPQDNQRQDVETVELSADFGPDLIALDQVLEQLAEVDPRQAQIVELRYFAGLSVSETAETMQVSERTVVREWRMARAWLRRKLA